MGKKENVENSVENVSCLRNEKVVVRYLPKTSGMSIPNPKHVAYGGMIEGAVKTYCLPVTESGAYVPVLSKEEQDCLEEAMGVEPNTLSIYKKVNNYWDNRGVSLEKGDNYLDLSDPDQYIKYKILLANRDYIAPSYQDLENCPKATYKFVLIEEGDEEKRNNSNISTLMQCYKEFGKIDEDKEKMRTIIEIIDGRPTSPNSKLDFLRNKVNDLIVANNKLFLKVVTDPLLPNKVLIKKAVGAGLIAVRGNYYYLNEDNSPMCEDRQEPTFGNAAAYISSPKRQALKFSLENKLKEQ